MLRTKLQLFAGLVILLALLGFGVVNLYGSMPEPAGQNQNPVLVQQKVPKPEEKPKPNQPGGVILPAPGGEELKKPDADKGVTVKPGSFVVISLIGSGKVIVKQTGKEEVTIRGDKILAQQSSAQVQNGTLVLVGGGGFPGLPDLKNLPGLGGNPLPGMGGQPLPGFPGGFAPGVGGQPLPGFPGGFAPGGVPIPGKANNPIPGLPTGQVEFLVEVKNLQGLALTGSGSMDVTQLDTKQLWVNVGGTGNLVITGSAEVLQVSITGSGSFLGEQLKAKTATVQHNGFAKAVVNVSDQLGVGIYGNGSVEYVGSPKVQQSILGLGRVTKKGP